MKMTTVSKHICRLLSEWAGKSYDAELSAELKTLAGDFNDWKNGKMTCFDLSEKIHEFHDGANRQLYIRYVMHKQPEINIASAIVEGLIRKESVPPELLKYLENEIRFCEEQKK